MAGLALVPLGYVLTTTAELGRQEAVEFMRRQGVRPAVSAITAAELFAGVRNSAEEHQIEALCKRLLMHHVDLEIDF